MFKKLFDRIKAVFGKKRPWQPEDDYIITLTGEYISVINPKGITETVHWADVHTILLLTTDQGPFEPDIWFVLIGTQGKCVFPQGAPKSDEAYDHISQFEGFDFEVFIKAMSITHNEEHVLWKRTG